MEPIKSQVFKGSARGTGPSHPAQRTIRGRRNDPKADGNNHGAKRQLSQALPSRTATVHHGLGPPPLASSPLSPPPWGAQWGQRSISDQDAERTVPQTWQKGLPASQPEECLQLTHLAYRADIELENLVMTITDSTAQRTARAIDRERIKPITSHLMIPWMKIRVRASRVRPAKPARVFDKSETNDAKK